MDYHNVSWQLFALLAVFPGRAVVAGVILRDAVGRWEQSGFQNTHLCKRARPSDLTVIPTPLYRSS